VTASHAGQAGRGSAGQEVHVSPGWRIVQALPSEPGSGQPDGGYNEMLSGSARSPRTTPVTQGGIAIGLARLSTTDSIRRDRLWHAGSPRVRRSKSSWAGLAGVSPSLLRHG
jgi:hypothetical protein